ncbi:uncharacterized protein LOC134717902 [Mytilus trossulus]|uniref:uncharacterized protein LOC134717902 n=1 Tax=Mytilus trossulus TaxID=6551 RepID=UPI0030043FFC
MASQHERQTGIIITGKTGSGKSSVGNALLQKPVFETGCLSSSITKKCVCRTARILDRRITVTDTPGLCDTNDDVDMKAEMENLNDGNIYTNADFNRAKQLIKKEQQRELDDQDRVQKAKKARIILEVEKANKKLQNTLAEQHAKDELEKQALQEKTKREREQKKEELVRAEEQQKYEIQLQEQRRRENIKQNILCFLDIVEFGCNMYMQYILRK